MVPHVLQCPDVRAQDLWKDGLTKLGQWIIENAIYYNLMAWKSLSPFPPNLPQSPSLKRALLEQDRIGWLGVFDGFLSQAWQAHLTSHFTAMDNPKSTMLWMSRLQK